MSYFIEGISPLNGTPTPVPPPPAGVLFAGALGLFGGFSGAVRRRKV